MSVITITKDNYEVEVNNSEKPVLLDFWAPWCRPCLMAAPIIDEIASEFPDIKVGKVNIDDQPELAYKFQATAIPTLVVVKEGVIAGRMVGLQSKKDLLKLLGKQ